MHAVAPGRDGQGANAGLTCWSPNTNLIKDPRWGRGGTETFSEDAFHTAELVKQYVHGLQGDNERGVRKLSATCKHTFGYQLENWQPSGDPDTWPDARAGSQNNISVQDLHGYYLKPFEACIEADSAGMMCSYNEVNGVPTCANSAINNGHYRDALNWTGFMVSDCGAIADIASPHHYANSAAGASAAGINGGCDANCGDEYTHGLKNAMLLGLVKPRTVDRAVGRLLREQIKQGELDNPAHNPYRPSAGYGPEVVDSAAHRTLALETAQQGITLLVNTGKLLPLSETAGGTVAFLGPHANTSLGMLGNYFGGNSVVFEHTPLVAARRAGVNVSYAPGVPCFDVRHSGSLDKPYPLCVTEDTSDHSHIATAVTAARQAHTAVLFLGIAAVNNSGPCSAMTGVEGEGCDRAEIGLPAVQETLLRAVLAVQPRTVVVLMNGGAVAMPDNLPVPALLEAFYAGEMGGSAIVNVLWAKSNRILGRMPYMIPQLNFTKERLFTDMSMTGGCGITHQYYKRRPQFQYGFGLTYSTFSFERHAATPAVIKIDRRALMADGLASGYSFTCVVTNQGDRDADAVVLSFITPGDTADATKQQPAKRLVAFERVSLLPGQRTVVRVTLSAKELAGVDENGRSVLPLDGETLGLEVGDVQTPSRATLLFTAGSD